MSTRANVHILDDWNDVLASLYVQMDGYPEGFGKRLCGLVSDLGNEGSNGYDEFAVKLISDLKNTHRNGNVYLQSPLRLTKKAKEDLCGKAFINAVVKDANEACVEYAYILVEDSGGSHVCDIIVIDVYRKAVLHYGDCDTVLADIEAGKAA